MSNTIIQIRRSSNTLSPTGLANGELAFSGSSNSLFIGAPDTGAAIRIGGSAFNFLYQSVVGVLTANAVHVTDSNSFISNTYTSGLVIGPSSNATAITSLAAISSISKTSNSTQVGLNSNADLVTSFAVQNFVNSAIAAAQSLDALLAGNNVFTGNNTFNGTNTVFTSNVSHTGSLAAVNMTANSLSLLNPLVVGSGGTGLSSLTNNFVVIGNTTGPVGLVGSAVQGQVLQISSTSTPVFGNIDGGGF
jgi:hypothetical protein